MGASPKYLTCLFAIALIVCFWGCSGDDEANPNNPGGGQVTDDPAVQAQIDKGLEVGNALMAMMPQWASGNFVGPPSKDAYFNENCVCWTWQEDLGNAYSNPYDSSSWSFTATFFAGETPVPDPGSADRVQVDVHLIQNSGFYPEDESGGDEGSSSFIAFLSIVISPVGGNPVMVSGGGTASYSASGSVGDSYYAHYAEFDVHLELTLPLPGCPSGIMTIETMDEEDGPTLFSVGYDGSTTAWWTLSQGWQGEFTVRGSETVLCGGD